MNSTSSVYNTIRRGTNGTIKTCFGQFVVSRYIHRMLVWHSHSLWHVYFIRFLFFSLVSVIDRLRLATYISISDKVRALKPFTNCISLYTFSLATRDCVGCITSISSIRLIYRSPFRRLLSSRSQTKTCSYAPKKQLTQQLLNFTSSFWLLKKLPVKLNRNFTFKHFLCYSVF